MVSLLFGGLFDPLTDLLMTYLLYGAALGWLLHWSRTPEGDWFIQARLLKKPAKIMMTFIPGRTFSREVVVPKTESWQKQPSQMQKFLAAIKLAKEAEPSDHTILPGWFRSDAPVYRPLGSPAQYVFLRQGEAPAFDIDRVEFGYYKPTDETDKMYSQAQALHVKNQSLAEELKKALVDQNVSRAEQLKKEIGENEAAITNLVYDANTSRAWFRVTVLPTQLVTVLLNNALSLVKAKEYKGFLGKLDALVKDIKWQSVANMVLAGVAALCGLILVFKGGGFNLGF